MTRTMAVLTLAGLLFTACGAGGDQPAGQTSEEWGPLAVFEASEGPVRTALIGGTLRLTENCAFLDTWTEDMLLVWPDYRTTWNADERTVTLEDFNRDRGTAGDGDEIRVGGGGSSVNEGGAPGDEWAEGVDWVSAPDESCPTDSRWFVGTGLREVSGPGTPTSEQGELSVDPSSGPVGTKVTLEGKRCWAGPGDDDTHLVFGKETPFSPEGEATVGADGIRGIPTDGNGTFEATYEIPKELGVIQGSGGGRVEPGMYKFWSKPARCQALFEVTGG